VRVAERPLFPFSSRLSSSFSLPSRFFLSSICFAMPLSTPQLPSRTHSTFAATRLQFNVASLLPSLFHLPSSSHPLPPRTMGAFSWHDWARLLALTSGACSSLLPSPSLSSLTLSFLDNTSRRRRLGRSMGLFLSQVLLGLCRGRVGT
jgi:hypothetical protein